MDSAGVVFMKSEISKIKGTPDLDNLEIGRNFDLVWTEFSKKLFDYRALAFFKKTCYKHSYALCVAPAILPLGQNGKILYLYYII